MEPQDLDVQQWQALVGTWATDATHPLLPGAEIRGETTFRWLEGRRFLIQEMHYEHPEIPDAIAVIGPTGRQPAMHYFDSRGVQRIYGFSFADGTLRFERDDPQLSQRFTGRVSEDGDTIACQGEMSRAGDAWEDDLAITYRRVSR